MTTIMNIFYRPTENHVGVIYSKWGKFKRFAEPNQWTFFSPVFEVIAREIRLDIRTARITLENVLTRDRVPIDLEMKIFYSVDVRQATEDRRSQVLRFESETAWEEIVKTGITDLARNVIVISRSFDELATETGRAYLKQALSAALAQRVRGFGILMNSRFAVSIMNLQPNETFRQALQDGSAARTIGQAAIDRMQPFFEQLSDREQRKAFLALVMEMAAAVAKTGEMPDIVYPNSEEFPSAAGFVGSERNPIPPGMPRISPSQRPKSIAGD